MEFASVPVDAAAVVLDGTLFLHGGLAGASAPVQLPARAADDAAADPDSDPDGGDTARDGDGDGGDDGDGDQTLQGDGAYHHSSVIEDTDSGQRVVVFGGISQRGPENTVLVYDTDKNTWSQPRLQNATRAISGHASFSAPPFMVSCFGNVAVSSKSDPKSALPQPPRLHGVPVSVTGLPTNQCMLVNTATWTVSIPTAVTRASAQTDPRQSVPAARTGVRNAMVQVPALDMHLVYGGGVLNATGDGIVEAFDDLWTLDTHQLPSTITWTQRNAAGDRPPPLMFHSMALVAPDAVVVWGGVSPNDAAGEPNRAYFLNVTTWIWTAVGVGAMPTGPVVSPTGPPAAPTSTPGADPSGGELASWLRNAGYIGFAALLTLFLGIIAKITINEWRARRNEDQVSQHLRGVRGGASPSPADLEQPRRRVVMLPRSANSKGPENAPRLSTPNSLSSLSLGLPLRPSSPIWTVSTSEADSPLDRPSVELPRQHDLLPMPASQPAVAASPEHAADRPSDQRADRQPKDMPAGLVALVPFPSPVPGNDGLHFVTPQRPMKHPFTLPHAGTSPTTARQSLLQYPNSSSGSMTQPSKPREPRRKATAHSAMSLARQLSRPTTPTSMLATQQGSSSSRNRSSLLSQAVNNSTTTSSAYNTLDISRETSHSRATTASTIPIELVPQPLVVGTLHAKRSGPTRSRSIGHLARPRVGIPASSSQATLSAAGPPGAHSRNASVNSVHSVQWIPFEYSHEGGFHDFGPLSPLPETSSEPSSRTASWRERFPSLGRLSSLLEFSPLSRLRKSGGTPSGSSGSGTDGSTLVAAPPERGSIGESDMREKSVPAPVRLSICATGLGLAGIKGVKKRLDDPAPNETDVDMDDDDVVDMSDDRQTMVRALDGALALETLEHKVSG
nr:hypothetical protein HK105_000253 [Polyrhizophydium stewartii]